MIYKSKIDTWLLIVVIGASSAMIYAIYTLVMQGDIRENGLLLLLLSVSVILFVHTFATTYYQIEQNKLFIHSGVFNWAIPLNEIKSVKQTRSLLSAPALSLDRLLIVHEKGEIMISPKNKARFLKEIEEKIA